MNDKASRNAGVLYIIATPIGNREDISARALSLLASVDGILAEDTRHTRALLTAFGINKPLFALHAHNEAEKSSDVIKKLEAGASFALVSDAGTPLISDPGYPLVNMARAHDIRVVPIPGACAFITALSAAGIPCDTFTFCGFLPAKQSARRERLHTLLAVSHTIVFYESSHRIQACIEDIASVFGNACTLVLVKELTKVFERFVTGSCDDVLAWIAADAGHKKGEFVLIIPARVEKETPADYIHVLTALLTELPLKQAVSLARQITGVPKNTLYDAAVSLSQKP